MERRVILEIKDYEIVRDFVESVPVPRRDSNKASEALGRAMIVPVNISDDGTESDKGDTPRTKTSGTGTRKWVEAKE